MSNNLLGPAWTLADRMRKVRREIAGLSQQDFAAKIGVNPATYAAWEGGRARPRTDTAVHVARRCEALYRGRVNAAWIVGHALTPTPPDGGSNYLRLVEDEPLPRLDSNQQPSGWRHQATRYYRHPIPHSPYKDAA